MPIRTCQRKRAFNTELEQDAQYHEERSHDPIDHKTEGDLNPDLSATEDLMERLVAYLAQDRVYHHQQPDRGDLPSAPRQA